jgi:hypothetical protein
MTSRRDGIHKIILENLLEIMPAALGIKIMPTFPLVPQCIPA